MKGTVGATSLPYDQCEMDEQSSKGDSAPIRGCRCQIVVIIIKNRRAEDGLVLIIFERLG